MHRWSKVKHNNLLLANLVQPKIHQLKRVNQVEVLLVWLVDHALAQEIMPVIQITITIIIKQLELAFKTPVLSVLLLQKALMHKVRAVTLKVHQPEIPMLLTELTKFLHLCLVKSNVMPIYNLLKYKLYCLVRTQHLSIQRPSNWRTTSQQKRVRRSAESSSRMQLTQIKASSVTTMRIVSLSFLTSWSLRIRLLLTLSGHRYASLVSLMGTVGQLAQTIWETTCIILLFKMNNSHKIQLRQSEKASVNVNAISCHSSSKLKPELST